MDTTIIPIWMPKHIDLQDLVKRLQILYQENIHLKIRLSDIDAMVQECNAVKEQNATMQGELTELKSIQKQLDLQKADV